MKEPKKEKKENKDEVIWDRKKIIFFVIILLIIIIGGYKLKTIIFDQTFVPSSVPIVNKDVKGASVDNSAALNIKKGVQSEINKLKSEAQNINIVDIASSSPQVQKVINDLKALQNYPSDQLRSTCINICSKL